MDNEYLSADITQCVIRHLDTNHYICSAYNDKHCISSHIKSMPFSPTPVLFNSQLCLNMHCPSVKGIPLSFLSVFSLDISPKSMVQKQPALVIFLCAEMWQNTAPWGRNPSDTNLQKQSCRKKTFFLIVLRFVPFPVGIIPSLPPYAGAWPHPISPADPALFPFRCFIPQPRQCLCLAGTGLNGFILVPEKMRPQLSMAFL